MKPNTLLFVDDDCHMAWAFGSDLIDRVEGAHLQLRIFTDADEAMEFIHLHGSAIACAIVDLWMQSKKTGEENTDKGYEIINALQHLPSKPRIAVLSAHIDTMAKRRLEAAKVACFRKPSMNPARPSRGTIRFLWSPLAMRNEPAREFWRRTRR